MEGVPGVTIQFPTVGTGVFLTNLTGFSGAERFRSDATATRDEIIPLVAHQLVEVEELFRANLASPVRIVDEIGGFVSQGGGKRIRPTLLLLCAQLCGYRGPHAVLLGTVMEFIHCATLIHDDIIDGATTRRGRPSVNFEWGNNVTVLFGDFMFAKAMEMALGARSLQVMERLADVTLRMTEGEMLQTRYVGRLDLTVEEHLDLIEKKTAALFACCCELPALLSELDERKATALRRYGHHLGLAFQLVDDLLDFTGDSATLGKPAASDLREGKATLAVIDLMSSGSAAARQLVERISSSEETSAAEIVELGGVLRDSGAIERAHQRAQFHARSAITELEMFDENLARTALQSLPDLLLFRDR